MTHDQTTPAPVEVTQADRMLVEAIINDYHTTRLDSDYVSHILSKPRTQTAFARHRSDEGRGEVTDTFDWADLLIDVICKRIEEGDPAAAAYLRTRIEAAFVPVERYNERGEAFLEASKLLIEATARAEAAEARVKVLEEALRRQGDNMAFVLNNMDMPDQWYAKFHDELAQDRQALGAEHE